MARRASRLPGAPAVGNRRCGHLLLPDERRLHNKPGKHPYGPQAPNGVKDASGDPGRIRDMLAGRTAYGLTPPKGVIVLDVDGSAIRVWEALEKEYGPAPASWGQTTANGRHLGYLWPTLGPVDPGGNLAGIVTRRDGDGYVVGPWSQISGHVYKPDLDENGLPHSFAHLPVDLAVALSDTQPSRAGGRPGSRMTCLACGELPETVGEGSRYSAILSLTMRLFMKGHDREVIWTHVRDHLAPRFNPPLGAEGVLRRFERAALTLRVCPARPTSGSGSIPAVPS